MQNERRQEDGTLEDFLIVVLAILTAALILKFWRNILNVFILVGAAFISIILIVLLLPIDIVLKC